MNLYLGGGFGWMFFQVPDKHLKQDLMLGGKGRGREGVWQRKEMPLEDGRYS
jgi:hypothetical protein